MSLIEYYIYLGLIEPVHYFMHVYSVERDIALTEVMTCEVYNCMIELKMIGPGQKVIVFNVSSRERLVWPVLANHVEFPALAGADHEALCIALKRLLNADRHGTVGFMIVAHFTQAGKRAFMCTTHNVSESSMISKIAKLCKGENKITGALQPLRRTYTNKKLSYRTVILEEK